MGKETLNASFVIDASSPSAELRKRVDLNAICPSSKRQRMKYMHETVVGFVHSLYSSVDKLMHATGKKDGVAEDIFPLSEELRGTNKLIDELTLLVLFALSKRSSLS